MSLDQFRGYTVAGMFVVNFLGAYAITHYGLKHNDRFLTWADTIMPSFMFICGVSFRLSVVRRLAQKGAASTYLGIVQAEPRTRARVDGDVRRRRLRRQDSRRGPMITPESIKQVIAEIIKADLWETLAIIGMTQILLIPVRRQELPRAAGGDDRPLGAARRDQLLVQLLVRVRQAELDGPRTSPGRRGAPGTAVASA